MGAAVVTNEATNPAQPAERPALPKLKLKTRHLGVLRSYRTQMHDVWNAMRDGDVSIQECSLLVRTLDIMRRARLEEDQLALMEKSGIAGVPFAGITVVLAAPEATNGHDPAAEAKTIDHQPPTNGHSNGESQ